MGDADLKAFGESEIPTPHLDHLAAEVTRCTSAFADAAARGSARPQRSRRQGEDTDPVNR
jgi:hypothetical protein